MALGRVGLANQVLKFHQRHLKNDYMGIARALDNFDTEHFETLRDGGVLTRDSRMKERKKPGLHGARRGTQFSKR